jgi:hypothetical protein
MPYHSFGAVIPLLSMKNATGRVLAFAKGRWWLAHCFVALSIAARAQRSHVRLASANNVVSLNWIRDHAERTGHGSSFALIFFSLQRFARRRA